MTEQDIDLLKKMFDVVNAYLPKIADKCWDNISRVQMKAIEACEKQLSKKPLNRITYPLDCDGGTCPNCNSIVNQQMSYCNDCGNKLDWNKEDETYDK